MRGGQGRGASVTPALADASLALRRYPLRIFPHRRLLRPDQRNRGTKAARLPCRVCRTSSSGGVKAHRQFAGYAG
jgi:hypothetical protein